MVLFAGKPKTSSKSRQSWNPIFLHGLHPDRWDNDFFFQGDHK